MESTTTSIRLRKTDILTCAFNPGPKLLGRLAKYKEVVEKGWKELIAAAGRCLGCQEKLQNEVHEGGRSTAEVDGSRITVEVYS